MKVILPVVKPSITSFQHHAAVISVVGEHPDFNVWAMTSYLQVYCLVKDWLDIDFYEGAFTLYSCPFLSSKDYSRKLIEVEYRDPISFVEQNLSIGRYVYVVVDGQYIDLYHAKEKHPHPLFIYGIDSESQTIQCGDFFNGGNFSFGEISFQQFEQAYSSIEPEDYWMIPAAITLEKRFESSYTFNINIVTNVIQDYINGYLKDSQIYQINNGPYMSHWVDEDEFKGKAIFGINVIPRIIAEFEADETIAYTVLPMLYDHKKIIVKLLEYLIKENVIKANYTQDYLNSATDTAELLLLSRNVYLKFLITNDLSLLKLIIIQLKKVYEKELWLLRNLLNLLEASRA